MQNAAVVKIFEELADLLEIQNANPFRVRAYRNAARTLETLPESLAEIANDPDRSLEDLPGIGMTWPKRSRRSSRQKPCRSSKNCEPKCRGVSSTCCEFKGWARKKPRPCSKNWGSPTSTCSKQRPNRGP